jgi:hypothetical protein
MFDRIPCRGLPSVFSLTAAATDSGFGTEAIQQRVNQIKDDELNQQQRVKQDERAIRLLEERPKLKGASVIAHGELSLPRLAKRSINVSSRPET